MEPTEVKKEFVKLGFSEDEIGGLVENLNLLLANYQIFYQKLRNYHWNVKGEDFFDLHQKFEELYREANENIDVIAERIRVFGKVPFSTYGDYIKNAEIVETSTDLSSGEMVAEVLTDMETMDSFLIDALDVGSEIGDVATADVLTKMVKSLEKQHWMLTAFTGRG